MVKFVDLKQQYGSIRQEINDAVAQVLESASYILGENLRQFEEEFSDYCNAKFCAGLNSGTSALHLALLANGIGAGDEVITVPNTFIATCEAISYTGATPRLVDIDNETYNIDTSRLAASITKKTKAIIPVHLYGQAADMKPVMEMAEKHNLAVIEDACQAHGAEHYGKKVPISGIGCFSFYPAKNLGAYGEGGCVVTDDDELIEKIKAYRDHGQVKRHVHKYIGYNYRLEELQAAILRVKLGHLDSWIAMRRKNALIYNELLKNSGAITPIEKQYNKHVYHLYVVRVKNRQKIMEHLNKKGIQTGIHYPTPIHLQEAYGHLGYKRGSFPIAEKYADEILSLPMYPELTAEEILEVCNALKEII